MNRFTILLQMLRRGFLFACFALISLPAFAAVIYDLDPNAGRYMSFDDYSLTNGATPTWQHLGAPAPAGGPPKGLLAGTNHIHKSGWSFMNCRMGRTTGGNSIPPAVSTNYGVYVQNTLTAIIQSPVFTQGVGSVYFDAVSVFLDSPKLSIFIATNMVSSLGDLVPIDASATTNRQAIRWAPVDSPAPIETITLASGASYKPYKRELNIRQPVCIKIERSNENGTTPDNYFAAIDNIRVSEPPSDVIMSKELCPFNAYPSVSTNMSLQFRIDNVPGPYPTISLVRNVKLVSRWNYLGQVTTLWVTNQMTCVNTGDNAGNGELWQPQAASPMKVYPNAGDLEYFFICAFPAGSYYQSYNYTLATPALDPVLFPPEIKSPRLYSNDGITAVSGTFTNNPFVFQLRLFPAQHDTVTTKLYVNGSSTPITLPMTLVGTNKWQAQYAVVNNQSATNLLWYFQATGAYTNAFKITTENTYWQNTNRTRIQNGTLPYGDNCGLTDVSITNRPADWFGVTVTPGESSYVLFTLDTSKTNYLAGRGEFQDFNDWNTGAAAQNAFTDVDDKYPKVSYSQNFATGWAQSYYGGISNWFGTVTFAGQTGTVRLGPENVLGQQNYWNAGSFQYVTERTAIDGLIVDAETTGQRRNQGIRLLGGSDGLGLGFLGQRTTLNGVGTVTYKARLSRPLATDPDYNYNVAYRWTDMIRSNYLVRCSIKASAVNNMSPENPSVSFIAYYQSPRKFYEYRIIQVVDTRAINGAQGVHMDGATPRDKRLRHEIWKWSGATPVRLAYSERTTTDWPDTGYDGWLHTIPTGGMAVFRIFNNATSVSLAASYNAINVAFTAENGASIVNGAVVDSSSPIRSGTYGFHSADCQVLVPEMQIGTSTTDAGDGGGTPTVVIGGESSNQGAEWAFPEELYSVSGNSFSSPTPSTSVKVLTCPSEFGTWAPFITQTVNSYAYQNFSATTNDWNKLCTRIQANSTIGVVIDGVRAGSWRGETMTATPSDNWKYIEAWMNYNVTDNWFAHLDASQADTNLIQSVQSERVLGLGSISFDYRVTTAPAQIKIQYTANAVPQEGSDYGWVDVTNMTFAAAQGWANANYYLAIAPATNLYVRIVNNIVTNRLASVDLKNIVIWNNPTNSPNDWAAYNMKITDTETNKWWLDKKTVATPRSGYMNNSTSADIISGRPMNIHNPYIMAPRLTRGLGSIAFLARAFTTGYAAGDTNTSITIYATTDAWDKNKPDADTGWTKLTTITGITNAFYRPFFYPHPTVPNDIKAVKLVVSGVVFGTGVPQRVCIDEIVVTEAIYPRFDITGVKLMLSGTPPTETKQPLEGEDIGIEAQLTNVLMDPQNITVKVTYVLGTNTWGVFNAPVDKQITKPLTLVPGLETERIYRTDGNYISTGIPEQEKYNVVQYIVWADYTGNGNHQIYQTQATAEHFVNPSWYFPIDLNKEGNRVTGAPKSSWTPYYISYDVPPGSVWINELNLNENPLDIGPTVFLNPYIEIAQPAWMDLTGWRMEILNLYYEPRLAWQIESRGAILPALGANGYGLFVIGPYDFEATTAIPPYPALSTTTTVHQAIQNIRGDSSTSLYPGGYRLVRPMGMYEHAIAYDWDRETLSWVTGDDFVYLEPAPQTPFKYVGSEFYNGSLSFTGTVDTLTVPGQYRRTDSTNTWAPGSANFNWTPGRMNVGQTFPAVPTPGGSNVLVTSIFTSPDGLMHGWQNNIRQNPLQFKLKKGQGTNFVFVAEPWFRFYSITSNNVEILTPEEQTTKTNYFMGLNNIQTNINLLSDLRLAPSVIDSVTTPGMIEWLQKFVDGALAPSYAGATGTDEPLSFTETYWLDLDPTQTNRLLFSNRDIVPSTNGLWLTLEMATINQAGNTNKVTHLLGDAMVSIWGKDRTTTDPFRPFGQYWISNQSFDSNFWSRTWINGYTNAAAWFKWSLNANDQRLSTNELINVP